MKDYRQLIKELPSNTIVCAVGEFNPPTVGHELLVKTVKKLAEQKRSAHVIYTSPSKNSLIQEDKKAHYLNVMFPKTTFKSINESNVQEVITELHKKYKKVILVVGTDQITEMRKLQNVELIPVDKDPEADNVKMKQFATKGLYEEFKKKLPSTIRDIDGKRLMNEMRTGLGLEPIKEQIVFVKDKLREKYFRGEIFNEGDIVESNGELYTIVKRGSNHLLLKEASGKLTSKWIQDVKLTKEKEMKESSKLAEGVTQPNGTDKIDTKTSEPMNANNKTADLKVKKGMITFYNYAKAQKIKEQQEPKADKKSNIGHTLVSDDGHDNLRRRKVKYHLGEQKPMTSYDKESGHENTAQHIANNPEHTAKQKKLAQSFLSRMQSVAEDTEINELSNEKLGQYKQAAAADASAADKAGNYKLGNKRFSGIIKATKKQFANDAKGMAEEIDDKATQDVVKATLMAKHAKEKESLADKHTREKESLSESEYDQTIVVATPHTEISTVEEDDLDDDEIDAMLGNLSDDEIMDEYDEEDLALVDDETGEEIPKSDDEDAIDEQAILEVLSRVERMKAKFRIRRTSSKRERATKIALKRYSNTETINKRARRLAIKLIKQRMLRGRDPSKISVGEKERIERALEQRKAIIGRIATRLTPRIRKVEKARMSHSKYTQSNQPNVF